MFTTNDSAYDAAVDLHRAGVRIRAVIDARPAGSPARRSELERLGIAVTDGAVVTGTRGYRPGHPRPRRPTARRRGRRHSWPCRATHC